MNACVVGNGPSALAHAARIDACDLVVRVNVWRPDARAGRAWHVWAGYLENAKLQDQASEFGLFDLAPDDLEIWIRSGSTARLCNTGPVRVHGKRVTFHTTPRAREFPLRLITCAWFRPWFDDRVRERRGKPAKAGPTTGLVAMGEVLRLRPARLAIVGFDAVSPEEDKTWGDWFGPFDDSAAVHDHDYPLEKELLGEWVASRRFCGHAFPETEPVWWQGSREEGAS